MKFSVLAASCLLVLAGCSSSPTGRKQITLFSPDQLNQMGAQSFDEMKQKEKISTDKAINGFVQCVADNIIKNVDASVHAGSWEVVVFDSEQVNAFALPGGKIGVFTGLLKVTEDANQLAAVVGHEVGHVIAQHSNERLSSTSLVQTSLTVAGAVMATQDVENRNLWMAGLGLGAQFGILMPYGRTHEKEADIIGQELMAKSGFNPQASIDLWHNMAAANGAQPPEFMSTHPSNETRIDKLTKHLPVANPMYLSAKQKPNCIKPKM